MFAIRLVSVAMSAVGASMPDGDCPTEVCHPTQTEGGNLLQHRSRTKSSTTTSNDLFVILNASFSPSRRSLLHVVDAIEQAGLGVSSAELSCLEHLAKLDMSVLDALDDPWLACVNRPKRNVAMLQLMDVGVTDYPAQHVEIKPDPNPQRTHIFTVGPESSGTCFVRQYVAAAFNHLVPKSKSDYTFYANETTWHISLPEGSTCSAESKVPILDDFGFASANFAQMASLPTHSFPKRYILNISSMVQNYRERQEKVIVFQVARDPHVALASKALRNHCNIQMKAEEEQKLSFEIMLQAMDMQEVITICYDQMLQEGASYLSEKLRKAGIEQVEGPLFPDVKTPVTEATLDEEIECTHDVISYMKLCPDSPVASKFAEQCAPDKATQ